MKRSFRRVHVRSGSKQRTRSKIIEQFIRSFRTRRIKKSKSSTIRFLQHKQRKSRRSRS